MESNDQFQLLEDKLSKAIEVFKRTRSEKRALEQDIERVRLEAKERSQQINALQQELIALRREREEVRARVEKLLQRIDGLTSQDSEG